MTENHTIGSQLPWFCPINEPLKNATEENICRLRASRLTVITWVGEAMGMTPYQIQTELMQLTSKAFTPSKQDLPLESHLSARIWCLHDHMTEDILQLEKNDYDILERVLQQEFHDEEPLNQIRFNQWLENVIDKDDDAQWLD